MINSICKKLNKVKIPKHNGEIKMLPFSLNNIKEVPTKFQKIVKGMIKSLPVKEGIAYLTVDGRTLLKGTTHRRGGVHIDGNYLPEMCGWGSGGGSGWKVGEGGRELSSQHHKESYENPTGGMLIVSDYPGCKGWRGKYNGKPGIGGDCSKLQLMNKSFILESNRVYYGNSQFLHESLPIDKTVHRTLVRITLPKDYLVIQ